MVSDAQQITSEQMERVRELIERGHDDFAIHIVIKVPEEQVARLRASIKTTTRASRR